MKSNRLNEIPVINRIGDKTLFFLFFLFAQTTKTPECVCPNSLFSSIRPSSVSPVRHRAAKIRLSVFPAGSDFRCPGWQPRSISPEKWRSAGFTPGGTMMRPSGFVYTAKK